VTGDAPAASDREILVRLLELTPEPPTGSDGPEDLGIDVELLLAAFETIVAARAEVLARFTPPLRLVEADRPLLVELERRQEMWQVSLATALRTIGEQRCGNEKLRAYARTV
jgi:hypothetical protein